MRRDRRNHFGNLKRYRLNVILYEWGRGKTSLYEKGIYPRERINCKIGAAADAAYKAWQAFKMLIGDIWMIK